VPKVVVCIVFELILIFVYIVLTLMCWEHWNSPREHAMAWLLLLFYVFFWIKTAASFAFKTFGRIIRDTQINADNPIEESYTLGWMGALMIAASVYTYY